MSLWDRIDEESKGPLEALWEALPGGLNGIPDIVARRAAMSASRAAAPKGEYPDLTVSVHTYSGPSGDLSLRLYRPNDAASPGPGLIYIHGGGMIMGDLDSQDENMREAATALGIPVASIDYRKAPEHPYPAAPEDCYAGVCWVFEHATDLGMDISNIGLMGASAGGGLTLAVALMLRDRDGPALKYLLPIYPMIDDRHAQPHPTRSSISVFGTGQGPLRRGAGTWAVPRPTHTLHPPVPRICQGYRRVISMSEISTCFAMRTLPSHNDSLQRASRWSFISGQVRTTLQSSSPPRRASVSRSGPPVTKPLGAWPG